MAAAGMAAAGMAAAGMAAAGMAAASMAAAGMAAASMAAAGMAAAGIAAAVMAAAGMAAAGTVLADIATAGISAAGVLQQFLRAVFSVAGCTVEVWQPAEGPVATCDLCIFTNCICFVCNLYFLPQPHFPRFCVCFWHSPRTHLSNTCSNNF